MGRAELRRIQKENGKKTKTYTLTQEQMDELYNKSLEEAVKKAFFLMLAIPLEILITEEYWMKSAKEKIPKFMDEVLYLYNAYEEGSISIEEMEMDLWNFAGVKCGSQK